MEKHKNLIFTALWIISIVILSIIMSNVYKNSLKKDLHEADEKAILVSSVVEDWCKENEIELSALPQIFHSGRTYDVSQDGDGLQHELHKAIVSGYVYIGTAEKGGSEIVFYQWSKNKSGTIGQYPDTENSGGHIWTEFLPQ